MFRKPKPVRPIGPPSYPPTALANEPGFVALVDRGQEKPGTRTPLTGVTVNIIRTQAIWHAADVDIRAVHGEWDALRVFNRDGLALADQPYGRQRDPYGGDVTIKWSPDGVMVLSLSMKGM